MGTSDSVAVMLHLWATGTTSGGPRTILADRGRCRECTGRTCSSMCTGGIAGPPGRPPRSGPPTSEVQVGGRGIPKLLSHFRKLKCQSVGLDEEHGSQYRADNQEVLRLPGGR